MANDDASGGDGTSKTTFNVIAGTNYQIQVDGYAGEFGNITLGVSLVPNDNFSNRIVLTGANVHVTGNNATATQEPGEPNPTSHAGSNSVWWTWTAPANGTVVIDTEGKFVRHGFGDLYRDERDGPVLAVASDNGSAPDGINSLFVINVESNQTYQIMVDRYNDPGVSPGCHGLEYKNSTAHPPMMHSLIAFAIAGVPRMVTGSNF